MREYRTGGQTWQARAINNATRFFAKPTLSLWPLRGPLASLMVVPDRLLATMPRHPATELEAVSTPTWRGELVRPRGSAVGDKAILYFHGGAFVFCGLGTHRRIVERLALRTGLPVLSVEYRQLPKALLHDSLEDAEGAFDWLVARGVDPGSMVLMGDSAGGHLAFALALQLRASSKRAPAAVVGLSPWLDFDHVAKRQHPNLRRDVFIPYARLEVIASLAAGGTSIDPLRSPVNASLNGFPPVLIQCAEDEILRHDAELMTDKLEAAGVETLLQVWQGQVHAFQVLAYGTADSYAALQEITKFVTRVLSPRKEPRAAPSEESAP